VSCNDLLLDEHRLKMEMSLKKILSTALLALSAVLLLNGCPSKPIQEQEPGGAVEEPAGARTSGLPGRGGYSAADLNDPSSPLYQRTIYFEYDSSDIRPQFIDILRAHASYLSSNSAVSVTLDGHTDERGTREYNLALGDRRADTVRRFLLAEGVSDGQIRTMSYGEERPANPGQSEAAWALNRRVELVY
jgi:peptidoglycan-associated lipoprotein